MWKELQEWLMHPISDHDGLSNETTENVFVCNSCFFELCSYRRSTSKNNFVVKLAKVIRASILFPCLWTTWLWFNFRGWYLIILYRATLFLSSVKAANHHSVVVLKRPLSSGCFHYRTAFTAACDSFPSVGWYLSVGSRLFRQSEAAGLSGLSLL